MSIQASYTLTCTDCRTSCFEIGTGSYHFESIDEAIEAGVNSGWHIAIKVPNGSEWDFCPRCFSAYQPSKGGGGDGY